MFEPTDDSFLLTDNERKTALKSGTIALLYLLLAAVVTITGLHAIMLVMSQAGDTVQFSGLWGATLDVIRVSFPVAVEMAAVVAGLGFVSARWRKGQVWVALAIEVVWVIFAAANMITFFAVERGIPLQGWQMSWVNYGLPISALVAGVLVYGLKRADPDNKRLMEQTAAQEAIAMTRFAARRDVRTSPQMRAIERQREWLQAVQDLRTAGYNESQIQFLLADTPELLVDRNKNGRPDLLEQGERPQAAQLPSGGPVSRPTEHAPQPLTPRNEPPRPNGVHRVEVAFPLDNDIDLYRPVEPVRPEPKQEPLPNGVHDGNLIGGVTAGDEGADPFLPRT